MWRSFVVGVGALAAVAVATPARAQDHAVSFNVGYFALRGVDSRVSGDVLNANRCIDASSFCEPLLFEVDDFNFATLGAEWLIGFGESSKPVRASGITSTRSTASTRTSRT